MTAGWVVSSSGNFYDFHVSAEKLETVRLLVIVDLAPPYVIY